MIAPSPGYRVAVVGATGAVGTQLLSILEQRKFPVSELIPFASKRSEGKSVVFCGKNYLCRTLAQGCFEEVDFAFFDASDEISKEWVLQAAGSGAWVIDNSAVFRMDSDIPLVVPEVNGYLIDSRCRHEAQATGRSRIFSGPNCSTVQMVAVLKPIHDQWNIRRVVVSTYQSTSGAGTEAVRELSDQTRALLNGSYMSPSIFQHQIAFNCIPHIGGFRDDGYTSEEHKLMAETRKILGLPELKISATAIRVPTLSCHAESVNVECESAFELLDVTSALRRQDGVLVQDDPAANLYPMGMAGPESPIESASGKDGVYVGRVRRDPSVENGLNLWVVSDNLRKGAALNAIQIGERIISNLQ